MHPALERSPGPKRAGWVGAMVSVNFNSDPLDMRWLPCVSGHRPPAPQGLLPPHTCFSWRRQQQHSQGSLGVRKLDGPAAKEAGGGGGSLEPGTPRPTRATRRPPLNRKETKRERKSTARRPQPQGSPHTAALSPAMTAWWLAAWHSDTQATYLLLREC